MTVQQAVGPQTAPIRDISTAHGLTEKQALQRLASEGYNELPRDGSRSLFRIILEVLREPMLALLLAGGIIYLVLGNLREASVLMVFAMMSLFITVTQEVRTQRVLEALRDLTSPRALVIRDGIRQRIAGRDVVRGDLLVISEGDRVAADGVILQGHGLEADESLLTGESVSVRKTELAIGALETASPLGADRQSHVFAGSLVTRGSAICEVTATGALSEIGKIGVSLASVDSEPPRLQTQIRRLVTIFAVIGGVVSGGAVLFYGLVKHAWMNGILAGIALGMALLPEEFPVVLTIFMAMGAWRISKANVLTRKAPAIEALGAATVLCTDKTGTLTENRMAITELALPDGRAFRLEGPATIPPQFQEVAATGILASALDPFDPMEKAFQALDASVLPNGHPHKNGWKLVQEYGLSADLLAVTQVWCDTSKGNDCRVAAKGAPEAILGLCGLDPLSAEKALKQVEDMASRGLRVLAVASADFTGTDWPASPSGFAFRLVGLVGLADPLRGNVRDAVAECKAAGVRVIMITGDYPETARAIAMQAGIDAEIVISGDDIARMDAAELMRKARSASVFARVMPDQKLKIVQALKADGQIVAMTGDGVNDAPSLKAAHIGIAMGGRGTDVAREAASIVLLNDDFGSIVTAIRLGRRTFDNIRKATIFILAIHLPIVGLALLPLILSMPVILWPVHIAFMELAIDPVCSLVFEAETEESNIMRRPPRDPAEPLLTVNMLVWGAFQGLSALALVAAVYLMASMRGMPENEVRALTFFTLILSFISLVLVNRSFSASLVSAILRPNRALIVILAAISSFLCISLLWSPARSLLLFGPLHADDLALTLAVAAFLLGWLEAAKAVLRKTSAIFG
jgi:Ca2+-transporting ATPase